MRGTLQYTIALLLLGVCTASGQDADKVTLERLSHSWLFQTARTFYDVDGKTAKKRQLTRQDILRLNKELEGEMSFILTLHSQYGDELSKFFRAPLAGTPKVKVTVLEADAPDQAPVAGSNPEDGGRLLLITFNPAFLRTLFHTAVIESVSAGSEPLEHCDDEECLSRFLTFVSSVDRGRVPKGISLFLSVAASKVELRYAGTVFFTLAHELGHYLFGHHTHSCDAPSCDQFQKDEIQADQYAAYLLTLRLAGALAVGGPNLDEYLGVSNFIGFPLFLERAYPRLGFDNQAQDTLCACEYPSADERRRRADEAVIEAAKHAPDFQAAAVLGLLRERVGEIKTKYAGRPQIAEPALSADNPGNQALFPIQIGDRYSYMDSSGKLVLTTSYGYARPFSEGLAMIYPQRKGDRHFGLDRAFIDLSGKIRFRVNFKENEQYNSTYSNSTAVGDFQDGRVLIEIRNGAKPMYGFLDKAGNRVIDADFDEADSFSEGLAAVSIEVHDRDINGNLKPSPDLGVVFLALTAKLAGFIYPDGQFAIEPRFGGAKKFSEGVAPVKDRTTKKWGYIDKSAHYVIAPAFENAWPFKNNYALVEDEGTRWFISHDGQVAAKGFATGWDYSDGLAAVNYGGDIKYSNRPEQVSGGKWGYIDGSGRLVIQPTYGWARPFSEGLAAVNIGGKILKDGLGFGGPHGFEGILGGKWGFIDTKGNLVVPATFDDVDDYSGGLARVVRGDLSLYINKAGQMIEPKP